MGVQVEFVTCLTLRNWREFTAGKREKEECIPEKLRVSKKYKFLKQSYRIYDLAKPIELRETKGKDRLSPPIARIQILESTHFLLEQKPFTRGQYKVVEII